MNAHSLFAPSAAFRWVQCHDSIGLGAMYPELEESESAAEGTAAHFVGSEALLGRVVNPGAIAPNGRVITGEMCEGADWWVADVLDVVGIRLSELQVEQPVQVPRIHADCWGTPDTWFFDQQRGVLYVWDFKFGHELVEAFENWQMVVYVCGILDLLGIDGRNDEHITIDMRVVQPRAYHPEGRVRSWRVKASDLRGYFNIAHHAAHGTGLRAGPHCLHCTARHACPTLRRGVLAAADFIGKACAEELPPEALGQELELLEHLAELIKARLTGQTTEVESKLRSGTHVPGWRLEQTYGRLAWAQPAEVIAATGDMLGKELRKPLDVVTPTQAKKLGVDASVIAAYSHTPRAGAKLARDANLLNRARAAFGATQHGD